MREAKAWVRESARSRKEKRRPEDKLWEVIYEDPTQNFKQRTKGGFKGNKKAAQAWANEHRASTSRGEYVDPAKGSVTFRVLAAEWFAAQSFERRHTASGYRRIINGNNHLMRTFGEAQIADITPAAVQTYVKDVATAKAAQTVRHQFYTLRMVLDFAVENDRLLVNPARRINTRRLPSVRKMHVHEEERYPLTVAETERIIAAMPEPYDVFTRLVAYTGIRPEEAVGLTVADVDTHEGTVHVRAVVIETDDGLFREEFTKTNKSRRHIDLDSRTLAAITDYIRQHRQRALRWFDEHPEHEHPGEALPLFVGLGVGGRTALPDIERLDFSKPMRYSSFNKRHWRKARKLAGVPASVRFYDLRHADVSRHVDRLGQEGAFTLKEIQERYGHSSAVMTLDRYAHSGKPDRAARRRALDAALVHDDSNVTPISAKRRTS